MNITMKSLLTCCLYPISSSGWFLSHTSDDVYYLYIVCHCTLYFSILLRCWDIWHLSD